MNHAIFLRFYVRILISRIFSEKSADFGISLQLTYLDLHHLKHKHDEILKSSLKCFIWDILKISKCLKTKNRNKTILAYLQTKNDRCNYFVLRDIRIFESLLVRTFSSDSRKEAVFHHLRGNIWNSHNRHRSNRTFYTLQHYVQNLEHQQCSP